MQYRPEGRTAGSTPAGGTVMDHEQPSSDDLLRAGISLAEHGWEVTLTPESKKFPPVPGTTGKGDHSRLSSADMATWMGDGYGNLGIVMPAGVIGLDVDHYTSASGVQKRGGDAIDALEQCAGALPATWRSTSRDDDGVSGIRFYRLPGGLEGREAEGFGGGLPAVEFIRCEHRYAIVAPSIHDSGRPYRWHTPDGGDTAPAVDDLPYLSYPQVEHLRRHCGCTFPSSVPNSTPRSSIDAAFHSSTYTGVTDAINTFVDALNDPKGLSRHDVMVSVVGRLVYDGVTDKDVHAQLRDLYVDAVHADRGSRQIAESEYNRAGRSALEKGFHLRPPDPVEEHAPEPGTMPSRIATIDEVENLPPIRWHIENLIPESSLVVMYGPPGSYKSFLAISLALSLDTGLEFLGHAVTGRSRPLYVVGEGFHGIGVRTRAWRSHWEPTETPSALFHNGAVNLASHAAVDELIEHVSDLEVGFVVFDTLARCTLGVEENSASEMGIVIANADRIRSATGAAVLLVHHSGKDAGKGSRGSSAIKGAADAELSVVKGRLTVEKMKDGPEIMPTHFRMVNKPAFTESVGSVVPEVASAPTSDDDETGGSLLSIVRWLEGEGESRTITAVRKGVRGDNNRISESIETGVACGELTRWEGARGAQMIGLPTWL